jgi:hypothetical protein
VIVIPPAIVEPVVEVAGIVLPPVSDIVAMFLAPILPSLPVADATRKILDKVSAW